MGEAGGRDAPGERSIYSYLYLRAGGVPTRHTHKWDGLHTRHLLESTHTNTHKHTPQSTLYHFTAERFCPFQPACDGATRTWFGPGASSDRRFHGSWQQRSVPHYGGTDFYQASQLAPLPYGFYRALPFEQRAHVQT